MFPARNKAICLWSINHTRKTTHHNHHYKIKSRDQVDDFIYQSHWSRGIPHFSYNFIAFQEVEIQERTNFLTFWSINYKWYWKIAVCACADNTYFILMGVKIFLWNVFNTAKFHEKTGSRSADIKTFVQWVKGVYTPPSPVYERRE